VSFTEATKEHDMTHPAAMTSTTRRQFIGAAGSFAALTLVGCGSQAGKVASGPPKRGGTLREARYEAIDGFKLDTQTANSSYQASQAVMEPLLRTKPDGRSVEPGLAHTYEYDSRAPAYTMQLAPGARFSDGSPVTAEDVAFSVKLWKAGPNYGSIYKAIERVEIVDSRTFRLHLASRNDDLPAFLTWSAAGIVPKDFGGRSETAFWQRPVGAGPFTVGRWEAAGTIELSRNPHYYRAGRPYLDRIVNTLSSDPNQRRLAFLSGEVDIVDGLNPRQVATFPKSKLIQSPKHFTDIVMFNGRKAPFDSVQARRAVAYAIDYKGIANGLYRGMGEVPTGALPPNVGNWTPPSKPYFSFDPTTAKQLAGGSGLVGRTTSIIFPTESDYTPLAELVQANLQAIGMKVRLVGSETGTFLDKLYKGDFELAIWTFNAISPDVVDPVSFVTSTDLLFSGLPERQLRAEVAAYVRTSDPAAKKVAVTRMQDFGSEQVPWLSIDHYPVTTAVQPQVRGVAPTPWGNYYCDSIWKG
jgi:peptide/nickel transport system substrate-binding protein